MHLSTADYGNQQVLCIPQSYFFLEQKKSLIKWSTAESHSKIGRIVLLLELQTKKTFK